MLIGKENNVIHCGTTYKNGYASPEEKSHAIDIKAAVRRTWDGYTGSLLLELNGIIIPVAY